MASLAAGASLTMADVIVLANRTGSTIKCRVGPGGGVSGEVAIASRDVLPLYVDGPTQVSYPSGRGTTRHALSANSAYYFGASRDGRIGLEQIGLGGDASTEQGRTLPGSAVSAPVAVIPVTIYVDEEEPATQAVWQRRLRGRVEAASKVLEKYCRVRLKVVGIGQWQSDNATTDFFDSLAEFEREVKPYPGRLAIGFTSQYQLSKGRIHMAGTRGPLHTHILVREWSQHVSEPERREFLVHELGHFLGASHSPERDSVMRPVLGNRKAVQTGFQVRFDPVNALIIGMVGEEIRRRKIQRMTELSDGSKRRLRQIYAALQPTLPEDPAAGHFLQILGVAASAGPSSSGVNQSAVDPTSPIVLGTKQIVAQIVRAAHENRKLPRTAAGGQPTRREQDELTEHYIQVAAGAARFIPEDIAPTAFLLGIGIALDDSNVLRTHGSQAEFVRVVESDRARALRLRYLGQPTIWKRRDLAKHFAVSAYLTAAIGVQPAFAAGLAKEMVDASGGSGFSFADLAVDRTGVLFAREVAARKLPIRRLSREFTVQSYVPSIDGLPEGLSLSEVISQYGNKDDQRFKTQLREIDRRLIALPAYGLEAKSDSATAADASAQP